jgi:uncharacterized membrane protein
VTSRAVLGLVALMVAFTGQRADAGFRVCNQTDIRISAALGYVNHARGRVAQGWWVVDVGQCTSLITTDLDNRYYYVYAESTADGGKTTWSGKVSFCIQKQKFLLSQAQYGKNTPDDCAKAGLEVARFDVVDVGQSKNHTVNYARGGNAQSQPSEPPVAAAPAPAPAPRPAPPPAAPGGGAGGTACQRYPNLC